MRSSHSHRRVRGSDAHGHLSKGGISGQRRAPGVDGATTTMTGNQVVAYNVARATLAALDRPGVASSDSDDAGRG